MRRALQLAERGRGRVNPNPMVGAVVVRDGRVVEHGPAAQVLDAPRESYTKALMAAAFELRAVEGGVVRE